MIPWLRSFSDFVAEQPMDILPARPLPERIVVYLDTSADVTRSKLQTSGREKWTSFARLQKLIRQFVLNKEIASCNGPGFFKFALMVDLGGSPTLLDSGDFFESKPFIQRMAGVRMSDVKNSGKNKELPLDIGEAIRTVQHDVHVHSTPDSEGLYLTRLVMFITRSQSPVKLDVADDLKKILDNQYFVVDILYLHEEDGDNNLVATNLLGMMPLVELQQGRGYVLRSGPDVTKWHNSVLLLLPSPVFRLSFAELMRTNGDKAGTEQMKHVGDNVDDQTITVGDSDEDTTTAKNKS